MRSGPYGTADPTVLGRRERLDTGLLGVLGIRVDSAAEAAGLLLDPEPDGLTVVTAREVVVDADRAEIEVGLDGEATILPTPVHCRVAPSKLRVRVPRQRPWGPCAPVIPQSVVILGSPGRESDPVSAGGADAVHLANHRSRSLALTRVPGVADLV